MGISESLKTEFLVRFNLCQSHRRWGRTWIRHPFLKSKAHKFLFCDASSVHLLKGININMRHTKCQGYRLSQIYFKICTTVVKKSSVHHCKMGALYWESLCLVAVTNSWDHKLRSERNRAGHQGQLTHIIFLFVGFRTQTSCLQTQPIRGFTTVRRAHTGTV